MAKIYISSTFLDLKECRARVYHALRKLDHDANAMEDYVAQDVRPLDRCLADVNACDIYVGIFAWRYGFIPDDPESNPDRRCITELEFRAAQQAKKPCLIFVLDERAAWLPEMMDSQTGDGGGGAQIRALRDELVNSRLVSKFRGCDELAELVSIAVTRQIGSTGTPRVTAAQQFRQISEHVLLACSEIDRAIADAWAAEFARSGLRVRMSPQALLSERESDFAQLERDATQSHSAIVILSGPSVDQLRTRADSARRVLTLLEARTRCSIALTTVDPGEMPADWPFTQVADLRQQGPATQPAPTTVAAVVDELERRCPTLRAREAIIGLPFVVVAMSADEAAELEAHPEILEEHLALRNLERFNELKVSLAATTATGSWTDRYGATRLEWRPLGGSLAMTAILDDVLDRLNGATTGVADRRIKLQYYPIDPWIAADPQSGAPTGDPMLRPLYQAVTQSGCVAMVDELSLFHPRLGRGAQTFLNQAQVSVVTVAPSTPARSAIEDLLETETRRQLALAYSRFESEFDPRIELRVVEERRLRRWLHASLPETLRQLREPPPNRGRLAGFRSEVGADRQGIANAIFREPGQR